MGNEGIEVEFKREIFIDVEFGEINVTVEFPNEIVIDQEFELNKREYAYLTNMVGDKHEVRKAQVAKYYFTLGYTIKDIAGHLGVSMSQIHRDIQHVKRDALKEIKKDLRANKKILGHMVSLMVQVQDRIRTIWIEYNKVDDNATLLRQTVEQERERLRNDPNARTRTNVANIAEAVRTMLTCHDRKAHYLSMLDEATKTMLKIWKDFGLCGNEALDVILQGGIDVDITIQQTKKLLEKVVYIIRDEVKDAEQQSRVFNRMAGQIAGSEIYAEKDESSDDFN